MKKSVIYLLIFLLFLILFGCLSNSSNKPIYQLRNSETNYTLYISAFTFDGREGGDVSVNPLPAFLRQDGGLTYPENTIITLNPIAKPGYKFYAYSGENAKEIENNTILMNSDKHIRTMFISIQEL